MHDDASTRTALAPAPTPVLGSDPHGFAALYIRHRASFTSHARRYLRDPRDADEVVQEAFLRLFLAMPELETELQALAYCRRTITNLCIDRYRADARRPRLVTLEGAPVDELAEDDTGDPVVRAEDAALVRQALSQLPALHRAALVMREIEEKPLPVIADELDVAEDSVKHLLFRARRGLRKLLAGTSVAPGADAERTRGLRPAARGASGGAAGLLLLALLGLGSGPDLRAVPVVGVDLPDVLGVTKVAEAVGGAVRDVVDVIVPRKEAHATVVGRDGSGRPVDRSEEAGPAGEAPAAAAAGEPAAQPSRSVPAATDLRYPGAPSGPPSGGRTSTVVTVVDGLPVITVVPPTDDRSASWPSPGGPAVAPGTPPGRGPGPLPSTPVEPGSLTGGRDVPGGTPVGPPLPLADTPARPGGADAPGRSPRAEEAVQKAADKAADRAADTAEKVAEAAERSADKAAVIVQKAQEKADGVAQKSAEKVARAERAADKAAEKATERAARAAAADRAESRAAAQRAAVEQAAAERAAARAAEEAAARAAERAAAEAAAVAAQQAAAAAVPVGAAVTTVVPAPAPVPAP